MDNLDLTGADAAEAFVAATGKPCIHVYFAFDHQASNVIVHLHDGTGRHQVVGTDLEVGDPTWPDVEALLDHFGAQHAAEEGGEGGYQTGSPVMPLDAFKAFFKAEFGF